MEEKKGFFKRLAEGLTKTRDNIVAGIDNIFSGFSSIDDDFYDEIEETLVMGDLGINSTTAIIEKLKGVSKENRKIKFITAMAISDGENTITAIGDIEGYVVEMPRGDNGFGFDEIFELEDGKTLAEISQDEKNEISARRKALELLKNKLG